MEWLGDKSNPFFDCIYKGRQTETQGSGTKYCTLQTGKCWPPVWEELPPVFVTSSLHRTGGEEILKYIDQLNDRVSLQNIERFRAFLIPTFPRSNRKNPSWSRSFFRLAWRGKTYQLSDTRV